MSQAGGIAGDHSLSGPSGAQDHVGVDHVRRAARGEQASDAGGVDAVEHDDVRGRLSYETAEP
jgi:hypothetical protein